MNELRGVGCEGVPRMLATGRREHRLSLVHALTEPEFETALAANQLVHQIVMSPYAKLAQAFQALDDGVSEALQLRTTADRMSGDSLDERFGKLLDAFNRFINRTTSWLSQRFGKGSSARTVFDQACRDEYDRFFEYRLAYNLQNETRHNRSVITVAYTARRLDGDAVSREISMRLADEIVNDPELSHWQARVREELRSQRGEVDAFRLAAALKGSTERIWAKTLLALRPQIDAAIANIEMLAAEAQCEDGRVVLFDHFPAEAASPDDAVRVTITPLALPAAAQAHEALAAARLVPQ